MLLAATWTAPAPWGRQRGSARNRGTHRTREGKEKQSNTRLSSALGTYWTPRKLMFNIKDPKAGMTWGPNITWNTYKWERGGVNQATFMFLPIEHRLLHWHKISTIQPGWCRQDGTLVSSGRRWGWAAHHCPLWPWESHVYLCISLPLCVMWRARVPTSQGLLWRLNDLTFINTQEVLDKH